MSAPVYTMTCVELGLTMTLAQWGISQTQRSLKSMSASELQLTFKRPFVNASPLAFGYHCTIYSDGTPWFVGKVYDPDKTAAPGSHEHVITLRDSWASLEAITYKQKAAYVSGPVGNLVSNFQENLTDAQIAQNAAARQDLANYPKTTFFTPLVYTGTDDTTGAGVDSNTTVAQVLAYALTQKPGIFQIGSGFTGIAIPREKMTDVSCAEVIRRTCRWTPDVLFAFDYTTTPPTLNAYQRSTMAVRTLAWPSNTVIQTEIKPRWDIYKQGVHINMDRGNAVGSLTYDTFTFDPAGDLGDPEQVLELTLQLDSINTDPNTGEFSSFDATPTGIAARLLTTFGTLFYDGQVQYAFQDLPVDSWLSKVVNITGADIPLATMRSLVQSSTEIIESGRVTLTLGAPAQLSASDFQALNKIGRARVPGTQNDVNGSANGGGGTLTIEPPKSDGSINGSLSPTPPSTQIDETHSPITSDFQLSTATVTDVKTFNDTLFDFLALPTPAVVGTSAGPIGSALDLATTNSNGRSSKTTVVSGFIDLTGFPPASYSVAWVVVTLAGLAPLGGGTPYSETRYMTITSYLGKKVRFSIPIGSIPLSNTNNGTGTFHNPGGGWQNQNSASIGVLNLTKAPIR